MPRPSQGVISLPGWIVAVVLGACSARSADEPSTSVDGAVDAPPEEAGLVGPSDAPPGVSVDRPVDRPDAARDAARDRPADGSSAANGIDGFRWELPCKGAAFVTDTACPWDVSRWQGTKDLGAGAALPRSFGGDAGTVYEVKIRIRGVVESNTYPDVAGNPEVDPSPTPHFLASKGYQGPHNAYGFAVSDPRGLYFINANRALLFPMAIDYVASVKIKGGATVTFLMYDDNDQVFANVTKLIVAGIPPAPAPFNGQFAQLDVVSVAPAR